MHVLILGASSFIAYPLIKQLVTEGYHLTCLARRPQNIPPLDSPKIEILSLEAGKHTAADYLVSLMPLWETAQLISGFITTNLRKAVLLSSSSVLTKQSSQSTEDIALVKRLMHAEEELESELGSRGIASIILRPTMIFGYGRDQNISLITRVLARLHMMPLLGQAQGLRQPLHAEELAQAITLALKSSAHTERLAIGGGTQLSYRELVTEIAQAAGLRYLPLPLPRPVLALALTFLRALPRYRHISLAMFDRMNEDLIVDNSEAKRLLGYVPVNLQEALKRSVSDQRADPALPLNQ